MKGRTLIVGIGLVLLGVVLISKLLLVPATNINMVEEVQKPAPAAADRPAAVSESETDSATATPAPTAAPTEESEPARVGGIGEIAINDSMEPPPPTPTPDMSGVKPVIFSLEAPEEVAAGDIFTVNITMDSNGNEIIGVQTNFWFDKGLVQVDSVTMGSDVDESLSIPVSINSNQGVSHISGMPLSFPAPFPDSFTFAVINLTANNPGNAELQLEGIIAVNSDNNPLPTKTEGASITIKP